MNVYEPADDPSAWTPSDLEDDRAWDVELSASQASVILDASAAAKRDGLQLAEIDRSRFPLPGCEAVTARIREQLKSGRGFALLHGFPVQDIDLDDVERAYWGFCAHLGIGVTQNSDATLIHYVTEGRLRPNQGTRGVGDPGKVSLHVDLADVATLLCIRQPEDSPPSRLASSTAVYNALLADHPDALARLTDGFIWDRQNEHDASETPTSAYKVPVFSAADGKISCRYNRNWITKAANRNGGFSAEDEALLDLFDETADRLAFDFPFNPGDVQFVNNYTCLHGRAPHRPAESEETTRLLMRIWFNTDGLRQWSDESIVRYGILRHGRLGWTGNDLLAGVEGRVHARRADGAPVAA